MIAMRSDSYRREMRLRAANRATAQSYALPYPSAPSRLPLVMGRMGWWIVGLALIWGALLLTAQSASAQSFQIFVPMVGTGEVGPGGSSGTPEACGLNEQEIAIAEFMINDSRQGRDNPVCNSILAQVARARARDMALRGYFGHTNPDGDGPNLLVREAGYPLPDWYSDNQSSNNIESISGGYTSADAAWQGWLSSSSHRTHVLATQSFYADQEAYGVGYYFNPDSPMQHYWVFLSAPVAE